MTKNITFDLDLFFAILKQSLEDVETFFRFSNPQNIESLMSTSKKSPTCAILPVEYWSPTNMMGAFEFFFNSNAPIYLSEEVSYSFDDFKKEFHLAIDPISSFYSYFRQKRFPLISPPLNLELDVKSYKVTNKRISSYPFNERQESISRVQTLSFCTLNEDLLWREVNRESILLPKNFKEKLSDSNFEISSAFLSTLDDINYLAIVVSKDCIYDHLPNVSVLKMKKYRQYFLFESPDPFLKTSCLSPLFSMTNESVRTHSSAGKLLKFISVVLFGDSKSLLN